MGCDMHMMIERKTGTGYECVPKTGGLFVDLDYRIFGFLAGVRNYSATIPISEPRGMPSDASPDTLAEFEAGGWGMGDGILNLGSRWMNYSLMTTSKKRKIVAHQNRCHGVWTVVYR